jgi:hypothetical protein
VTVLGLLHENYIGIFLLLEPTNQPTNELYPWSRVLHEEQMVGSAGQEIFHLL